MLTSLKQTECEHDCRIRNQNSFTLSPSDRTSVFLSPWWLCLAPLGGRSTSPSKAFCKRLANKFSKDGHLDQWPARVDTKLCTFDIKCAPAQADACLQTSMRPELIPNCGGLGGPFKRPFQPELPEIYIE